MRHLLILKQERRGRIENKQQLAEQVVFLYILMDKAAKNYIDQIVKPLLNRIQYLERSNEELKIHVKYLESLVGKEKTYAKPTISASQHMRESRVSSKLETSPEKRPNWNSKTKIEYAPVVNRESPTPQEKVRVKPPIPKLVKSPSRKDLQEDIRNTTPGKKACILAPHNAIPPAENASPQKATMKTVRNSREGNQNEEDNSPFEQNIGQIKERSAEILTLNDKFEQLVKNNTEILSSMKQNNLAARDTIKTASPSNYVQVGAPKSQYNHESQTTSPIDRSFVSQSHLNQAKVQAK